MKNSSGQMRQTSRRMKMIHPTIGWRRDEHGTHKHAHGSWILWSVSCVCSETMHSLHYVTVALHYSMLHRFKIFLPLEQSHTALLAATSEPCVFARLLIANNSHRLSDVSQKVMHSKRKNWQYPKPTEHSASLPESTEILPNLTLGHN